MKLQSMLTRQIRNKLLVRIGLRPAQLVVEMNYGEDDAEFVAQVQQQAQERDRINPAGNCDANAIARVKQFLAPDMGQDALC